MAASYGALEGDRLLDQEKNASEVVEVKPAPSTTGRWFSVAVVAMLVTASVFLVTGSSSSSIVVSWMRGKPPANLRKYVPLDLHKTTTEDEETAVDTAVWSSIGQWNENGLGAGYWNAFGATNDLSTCYVTDTSGNLKVSGNGGTSFTSSTPFTYTYGGSSAAYTITQVAVAGSSGSVAYASTTMSYIYGGGNSPGKIFKTTNSGTSWTAVTPSTSSNYISYSGVATSSTGQYVLAMDTSGTYSAYVSSDYGSTYKTSYTLNYYYPFLAGAVSSTGQWMYMFSKDYLFIHSSYGSTSSGVNWGYTYYPGISSSGQTTNKISVSSAGDKLIIAGAQVLYSSNYGASLILLSPTDTKYSNTMYYKIVDAQISPDGSTVAVIQSGTPIYYSNNEAFIRYTTNPASGSSATWTSLYPSSLGGYGNNWFISMFKFNTAGTSIVAVAPTKSYYNAYYQYITKQGSGWTGYSASTPTAAPTVATTPSPTKAPSAVPTNTPAPTAVPSFAPTNKPVATTPAPTGAQVSGSLIGRGVNTLDFNYIASTSAGSLFAAYSSNAYGDAGFIYGSLDGGSTWVKQTQATATTTGFGCSSATIANARSGVTGLKAVSVNNKNTLWFTCGPYTYTSGTRTYTYLAVYHCNGNIYSTSQFTCVSSSYPTANFNSAFLTVGSTAISPDGTKFAVAGREAGLLLFKGAYTSGKVSSINSYWGDVGSSTLGNNKYGGLAYSYDGTALLVAPNNGLNLWYVTIPDSCYSTSSCKLAYLTATTSPSLPASTGGSTGTWTSCAAMTDNNYMACTQYGGYTYYSTNSGVSWSKLGTKTTFIKRLEMYYGTSSGKACLAGISTYGSPYLMTNKDGQSTTEWVSQTIGDRYWGYGYYDVTVNSCSNIYATAVGFGNDKNILATSGSFTEVNSFTYTFEDTTDDSVSDPTDYAWTWGELSSSTSTSYSAIAASSDSIYIYSAFTDSKIRVSSDGGNSWSSASEPGQADWTDIATSSNGQYVTAVSSAGDIWSSIDNGATWTSAVVIDQDTYVSVAVSGDGKTVFLGGNNGAYLSTDSGSTYASIQTSNYIDSNSTYGFNVVASDDGSVLIAASGFGGVISSSDSGATWAYYPGSQVFTSITYANGVVYGASVQDGLYSSSDYGATWTLFDAAPEQLDWKAIAVSSDGTFIAAAASYQRISVSDDGGKTWGTIGTGDLWTDLVFVSDGKVLLATSEGKNSINQAVYSDSSSSSLRGSKKSSSKKSSSKKSSGKKSSSKKSSGK